MSEPHISHHTQAHSRVGRRAGVVTRTIAGALDYAVTAAVIGIGYVSLQALVFVWNPHRFEPVDISPALLISAGSVFMLGYLTFAWSWTGKTVGGLVMGTRVVDASGGRLDFARSVLRAGFTLIFAVGLFWCALEHRRSIQDTVLRTQVLYT